ncbi:dihydrolipoyl dehydrogenase family protein [Segeticoccus rhizosphaerae]|jgi:pyruvate/2-oxoglutarate dehydrogenase complex dihydrolipoamide dehydrogenase (E3) component|uniref:dihydrolipoyl dehydrogenase family protein n=1 Tax=Segeticoccus rhizosphaerae TaxID=1104777 RepID=UPI001265A81F|nr:FAD-dependent oxidoreductase [Segeticoccus rhizosphaerae]
MKASADLLVVGGGTAGLVSARTAAGLGARVLLVERGRTGGDCLWTGCVPSKSLLAAAAAAAGARDATRLGVHAERVRIDFPAVMDHVHSAIDHIEPTDSPASLRRAGVRVETGEFCFTGTASGTVAGRPIRFDQAIIATGSAPLVPKLPGLSGLDYLTSDTLWDLRALPPRMAVLGGGNIGCELGQAFARLGSQVTIIEATGRLLPREDPAASALVEDALARDGARVLTGTGVTGVIPTDAAGSAGGRLVLQDGTTVGFSHLLVAVGRSPRSAHLGLDAAGVECDQRGHVRVDAQLRTTTARIWAAGDITGHPQFTHLAGAHASLAASNAVLGLRRRIDPTVPRVTFTQPEVAAVGVSTAGPPDGVRLRSWSLTEVDRAVTDATTAGFTTIATDAKGRVLGATVVGPRAGEALAELTLAVRHRMRIRDLAGTTHPYPTYADAGWNAAIADVRASLTRPPLSTIVRTASTARRHWVHARARLSSPLGGLNGLPPRKR